MEFSITRIDFLAYAKGDATLASGANLADKKKLNNA